MAWVPGTTTYTFTGSSNPVGVAVPEVCTPGGGSVNFCDTIVTFRYDLSGAIAYDWNLADIFTTADGDPVGDFWGTPLLYLGESFRVRPGTTLSLVELSHNVVCNTGHTCHRRVTIIEDVFTLHTGDDTWSPGGIMAWVPGTTTYTFTGSSNPAGTAVPEICAAMAPLSAPMMAFAPRRIASREDFVPMRISRPVEEEIIDPDRRMRCHRVFKREPLPFTNLTLMREFVDVFHGTEQVGHEFPISSQFLGEYVMIDSTCSWTYTCDKIILIAGDHIRATRVAPTRTRDLVRSWQPEVVFDFDTIRSNCLERPEDRLRRVVGAQPIAYTSVVLPSTDLATAERVDAGFDIPFPHLQYFTEEGCTEFTIYVSRFERGHPIHGDRVVSVPYSIRHCEPLGQIGSFLANVTCDGVTDASFLVCDSILTIDTIQVVTQVSQRHPITGAYDCHDSISYRFDSIWTFTCWRECPIVDRCDTIRISGDTIIHYIFDSIVERIDTFFMIGNEYPQLLTPFLDTMDIVMEIITGSGCHLLDTFRIIHLRVPREHILDTSVSHGDTLHLFAASPYAEQWWIDLSENYFLMTNRDLILDACPLSFVGVAGTQGAESMTRFRYDTRFVGDTFPMERAPLAFRGDTVDMVLHSMMEFPEHNVTCITRDTVAIEVQTGFRIGGFISYDRFWSPGESLQYHRPIGHVIVDLVRVSTGDTVARTVSDTFGFFEFEGLFPRDIYVLKGSAPDKHIIVGADEAVNAADAQRLGDWIVNRDDMPYRIPGQPHWTERTMMYIAANVNQDRFAPYDFFGLDAADLQQIEDAIVGVFHFPRLVDIGGIIPYATGSFFRTLTDGTRVPVPDWQFSNDTIDLEEHIDTFQMMGVMTGDVDLNYFPRGQHEIDLLRRRVAERSPSFESFDTIFVNRRDRFINIPIIALQDGEVGAMQLHIDNLPSNIEMLNITPQLQNMRLRHNIRNDDIRMMWITHDARPITFRKGDVIANLVMKVNAGTARAMRNIPSQFTLNPRFYGAWDGSGNRITDEFRIGLPVIAIDNDLCIIILDSIIGDLPEDEFIADGGTDDGGIHLIHDGDIQSSHIINIIPNPMVDYATVTYSISEEAFVTMRLFNLLGVEIRTLMTNVRQDVGIFRQQVSAAGLPNGVYILHLETTTATRRDVSIEKIIVNR